MASTFTWTLESGTLPPGTSLTLSETDLDIELVGTPTEAGVFNFTVRITNDVSGAFDEQSYEVSITAPSIEVTPDLGLDVATMFSGSNPKLMIVPRDALIDVTGQGYSHRYNPVRRMRFHADFGDGMKTWEVPIEYTGRTNMFSRRYFWRLSGTPDQVREMFIV